MPAETKSPKFARSSSVKERMAGSACDKKSGMPAANPDVKFCSSSVPVWRMAGASAAMASGMPPTALTTSGRRLSAR